MGHQAFTAWLETFAQDDNGLCRLLEDDAQMLDTSGQQQQQQPGAAAALDISLLIQQLTDAPLAELMHDLETAAALDCGDMFQQLAGAADSPLQHGGGDGSSSSRQHAPKKMRPKNVKRYKSQAQRDAHKRYRERKKQNITAMEQEVAAKHQQLLRLQAENTALQSKLRVLETSLNCSTQIHGLMQLIDDVHGLRINSNEESGTSCGSSPTSRSGSNAAAAAATPAVPGLGAGLLCSSGSTNSSAAVAAVSRLDATGCSDSDLLELLQQQQLWCKQQDVPDLQLAPWTLQQQQQQQQDVCQLQQRAALPGSPLQPLLASTRSSSCLGSSSPSGPVLLVPEAAAGNASSSLQAIFAQQQQQQQALSLAASGNASGAAVAAALAGDAAAASAAATAAAASAVGAGSANAVAAAAAAAGCPLSCRVSSPEQGVVLYKEFLAKAKALMVQRGSSDPETAAAADLQLDKLTRSVISEVFQPFLVARGQGVVYDMVTRSLETLQPAEPPENLWPAVLQAMALSEQQRQDALACFHMFGACLSRLVDQRLALNGQYKSLQKAEEAADDASKVMLRAHSLEVLQAISKSLAAYQSLDGVFAHSVTSIISGSQLAVACVSSYPWLPQWHKIMAALQQQDEAAHADAVREAQVQDGAKKPVRRGRPPRRTQPLGMQHVVKA